MPGAYRKKRRFKDEDIAMIVVGGMLFVAVLMALGIILSNISLPPEVLFF